MITGDNVLGEPIVDEQYRHVGILFFKFPNKTIAEEQCKNAGLWQAKSENDKGEISIVNKNHIVDVVGIICQNKITTVDGFDVETVEALDGFHINIAGEMISEWEEFRVFPKQPYRVFL